MIAPILPGAEALPKELRGKVDSVILDRLNYHYADCAYREHGMAWARDEGFFTQKADELKAAFENEGISCQVVF